MSKTVRFLGQLLILSSFIAFMGPNFGFAKSKSKDWEGKASSAFDKGKYAKAISLYEKAQLLNPHDPKIHLGLARSYDALGHFKIALSEYDVALQNKPKEPHVVYNDRGVTYAKMKNYDKAIESFQKSIKIAPKFALGYYNLGKAYYASKNKVMAQRQFNKLKSMNEIDMAQSLWEQIYK